MGCCVRLLLLSAVLLLFVYLGVLFGGFCLVFCCVFVSLRFCCWVSLFFVCVYFCWVSLCVVVFCFVLLRFFWGGVLFLFCCVFC